MICCMYQTMWYFATKYLSMDIRLLVTFSYSFALWKCNIFWDKELYQKIFGDNEKLKKFLRWRVQILEKGIKHLDFKPGGVNAMIQITDLENIPKKELRVASNQILALFQDNYPKMVARKVYNYPKYICFCLTELALINIFYIPINEHKYDASFHCR